MARPLFEEILQICIVLFIISIFASFCMSNIFTLIDIEILKIQDISVQRFAFVIVLFCQLLVTVFIYLMIDIFLFHIKSIRAFTKNSNMSLGQLHAAEYCIHIILILVLIEMNSSLMTEIKYVRKFMTLTKTAD